jgi:alkylation response protein AidB-like acyl-CoA dehydrogenase
MYDFSSSDEQATLVKWVRELMDEHATPRYLSELDESCVYPYELYRRWAAAGLLSLPFSVEDGGCGGGVLDMVLVAEEIGRKGYDLVGVYGTPTFCAMNIAEHGSDELRRTMLPPFFDGARRFAVSITEPDAGSDASSIRTRAVADGESFVVNGAKIFTSGALVDNTTLLVYCRSDPSAPSAHAMTCLLIDADYPGVTITPVPTLGRHLYQTTQISFDDVRVPVDRVLGPVNGGWKVMMSGLLFERIVTSAAYVGNAQCVVDEALTYAKQRHQFGKPIGDRQVIAHRLADMQTGVDAARLLTYRAAWMLENGCKPVREVSMAKLFGSETFRQVALDGVQIMGGYGYCMEFPMQRHLRAAVGGTISAGTSQMQRQTIARRMGLKPQ